MIIRVREQFPALPGPRRGGARAARGRGPRLPVAPPHTRVQYPLGVCALLVEGEPSSAPPPLLIVLPNSRSPKLIGGLPSVPLSQRKHTMRACIASEVIGVEAGIGRGGEKEVVAVCFVGVDVGGSCGRK